MVRHSQMFAHEHDVETVGGTFWVGGRPAPPPHVVPHETNHRRAVVVVARGCSHHGRRRRVVCVGLWVVADVERHNDGAGVCFWHVVFATGVANLPVLFNHQHLCPGIFVGHVRLDGADPVVDGVSGVEEKPHHSQQRVQFCVVQRVDRRSGNDVVGQCGALFGGGGRRSSGCPFKNNNHCWATARSDCVVWVGGADRAVARVVRVRVVPVPVQRRVQPDRTQLRSHAAIETHSSLFNQRRRVAPELLRHLRVAVFVFCRQFAHEIGGVRQQPPVARTNTVSPLAGRGQCGHDGVGRCNGGVVGVGAVHLGVAWWG